MLVALLLSASQAAAQGHELPAFAEPTDESTQYMVEELATGLSNPTGLTVRSSSSPPIPPFELFFSESGAGRIVRIATDKPREVTPVITGFAKRSLGETLDVNVGPLGLAFISRTRLAVGTGGLGPGKDIVAVYSLPADGQPVAHDKADYSVGPVTPDSRTQSGEGAFFSLARIDSNVENAVFATSLGDAAKGWVLKASADGNKLADLQPFIASRQVTGSAAPMAVTINPKDHANYLLIGQMGDKGNHRDSVVGYYGPASGTPALVLKTGLYDIVGLTYGPNGDLYAVDAAWHDANDGGVYRIDAADVDGRQSVRAVKIAAVKRPTSLAFTPDGTLYVTAWGEGDANGNLLKITPGPNAPKL